MTDRLIPHLQVMWPFTRQQRAQSISKGPSRTSWIGTETMILLTRSGAARTPRTGDAGPSLLGLPHTAQVGLSLMRVL